MIVKGTRIRDLSPPGGEIVFSDPLRSVFTVPALADTGLDLCPHSYAEMKAEVKNDICIILYFSHCKTHAIVIINVSRKQRRVRRLCNRFRLRTW